MLPGVRLLMAACETGFQLCRCYLRGMTALYTMYVMDMGSQWYNSYAGSIIFEMSQTRPCACADARTSCQSWPQCDPALLSRSSQSNW